jgi:hypothetical protein
MNIHVKNADFSFPLRLSLHIVKEYSETLQIKSLYSRYKSVVTCCNQLIHVRFEVFTAVNMKNGDFWDVTPCGSCKN